MGLKPVLRTTAHLRILAHLMIFILRFTNVLIIIIIIIIIITTSFSALTLLVGSYDP